MLGLSLQPETITNLCELWWHHSSTWWERLKYKVMHFALSFFALLLALHFARVTLFSWETHSFTFNFKSWRKEKNLFLSNPSMLDSWPPYIPQLIAELLYGINSSALNSQSEELSLKTVTLHSKVLKGYAVSWRTGEPLRNAGAWRMSYGVPVLHSYLKTGTTHLHFHTKWNLPKGTTWDEVFSQLKNKIHIEK